MISTAFMIPTLHIGLITDISTGLTDTSGNAIAVPLLTNNLFENRL